MSLRVVSFNPDMNFKIWCDRWLAFRLKDNPHFKPEPDTPAAPAAPVESYEIVVENTLEASCWAQYNRANGFRPLFFCKQVTQSGSIVIGARCKTLFPPGYDEATGEKLPTKADEDVT